MANLVVQGTMCRCAFGAAPLPILPVPSHKVMGCSVSAATIMDNKFPPFGTCSNPVNPAVIAAMGSPVPCSPVFPAPWVPGCPTVLIGGKPALSTTSQLMCVHAGGIVSVVSPIATTIVVP